MRGHIHRSLNNRPASVFRGCGFSDFGYSNVYMIFEDGTDIYCESGQHYATLVKPILVVLVITLLRIPACRRATREAIWNRGSSLSEPNFRFKKDPFVPIGTPHAPVCNHNRGFPLLRSLPSTKQARASRFRSRIRQKKRNRPYGQLGQVAQSLSSRT